MRHSAGLFAAAALLVALLILLPHSGALFAAMFPSLQRPVFTQDSLAALALNHAALVLAAGAVSGVTGVAVAIAVTRRAGAAFRPVAETLVAMAQTVPPVAVLALAVPAIGFGPEPALIALALYGLLPIVQASLAGIDGVPAPVIEAASGLGFGPLRRLLSVELPLALPLILAGLRTSIAINVGTATTRPTSCRARCRPRCSPSRWTPSSSAWPPPPVCAEAVSRCARAAARRARCRAARCCCSRCR